MLSPEACYTYKRFVDKYQKYIYPLLAANLHRRYGKSSGRVIDMGTGPGYLTGELLSRIEGPIHALDINPAMHEIAYEYISTLDHRKRVIFDQADIHDLPYGSDFVDLIVSYSCYHHWENPVRAIRECYRVLKPGGKLFVIDTEPPADDWEMPLRSVIREPEYFAIIAKAFSESRTMQEVERVCRETGIPEFTISEFQFEAEDIVECIDDLGEMPEWSSGSISSPKTWILEIVKQGGL
ncbi:class I SAM-dependent methyltransferase [Alicyclobacillus suci]|uniref:class I SAM-dependent methyltransferase n=1 Tax=Alicyclobacillus suci TaxID=2816080 RepID=UPI001A8EE3E0|nr:class I SAM-dependent methyltransferase [Alicyclobacillus suci]